MPAPRPMPADFAALAETQGNGWLCAHYSASPDTIRRWRRLTNIPIPPSRRPRPIPDGFAAVAPTHTESELRARYKTSIENVRRWLFEAGVRARGRSKAVAGFTTEEDKLLLQMRGDGARWYEVAERLGRDSHACQWRHVALVVEMARTRLPLAPSLPPQPMPVHDLAAEDHRRWSMEAEGCRQLLRAQLRTGQYFPKQRAEWLARHGEVRA